MLWELGERQALASVLDELFELAVWKLLEVRINRGDLAADLLLAEGLTDARLRNHSVTRSHQAGIYIDRDAMQTYDVGASQSGSRPVSGSRKIASVESSRKSVKRRK